MAWFIYFGINILSGIAGLFKVKQARFLLLIVILNILLFIGMRYKIGVDWAVYEDLYEGREVYVPFEIGYVWLSNLFSFTGLGFWFFVFFITLTHVLILTSFFRTYSPYPIFCLAYYFILSFAFNIEALRQILAVSIAILSIISYVNNRRLAFFILVLLATSMHVSALIFLLIPLIDIPWTKFLIVPIIISGLMLALLNIYPVDWLINILNQFISNSFVYKLKIYTVGSNVSSVITINLIFKMFILFLLQINKKNIEDSIVSGFDKNVFKIFFSIFYLMLFIDIYLGKFGPIKLRLDEFFMPVYLIVVSVIISSSRKLIVKQLTAMLFALYAISNIIKFTQNDYFIKQFSYSNSLLLSILPDKKYDDKRSQQVNEHWIERDKIKLDE